MVRFWSTRVAWAVIASASLGCRGQTLEGRWEGPLPFEGASTCATKLFANGQFVTYCRGGAWTGQGRWEATGTDLNLRFEKLLRRDRLVPSPPPLRLAFEGRGNELDLRDPRGGPGFTWRRRF